LGNFVKTLKQSVALYTLGCKLNFAESSTIAQQLVKNGFDRKEFLEGADLYVINTCSVTDHADRKCKKVVREALKHNPEAYIVIVGCYAQLKPQEIAEIPGVDLVLGAAEKFQLMDYLHSLKKEPKARIQNQPIKSVNEFVPGFSEGDRTRMFLKVQDGCDYFCSFCTIPLARGKSRSATVATTLEQVKKATENGVQEVVLTGVNLGDFGVNHGETFFDLIQELDQLPEIKRYRISSIEPNLLSPEIIDFVAQSQKFVPHFHIPLQSGNDELLQRMRRKYLSDLYRSRIEYIKLRMPDCGIGVDVIVGFPGETESHFLDTFEFLNELPVSYLHVFPYSERANTTARKMQDAVPQKLRNDRTTQLRSLSEKKKRAFYESQIGKTRAVLFETEVRDGKMQGYTDNYVRVVSDYDPLAIDTLVAFNMQHINADFLMQGTIETLEISR
jgi:threonylcarbamoyladenosine tRNA methylthiotransferase MtaB